ncbi:MAG TPA: carotenoid oxygenase family protein [Leptolyngbyaceae cyanobacterium]
METFQLYEHASTVPAKSYNNQDWQGGYESLKEEFDYEIDDVEGKIPEGLQGTLFRNGPGLFERSGQRVHHPFDGDGMICAIAFANGRAHFCNRYVRTQGFVEEEKAGKYLYRGVFGTQKPGGWLANAFDFKLKNIANTQVIYWGGKLLALWEAAEPHRLNPRTLETLGLDYLEGGLKPGDAFAAHPRLDPEKNRLVNFSIKPGLSTTINIYELDQTGKVVENHAHSVPGFAFIHDFAITPNYCIFFQNPVSFNPLPFLLGWQGAGECVKFRAGEPTQIIVIPRNGKKKAQILAAESGFVFHHANAFERDRKIYIDSVCYESLPTVEPGHDYRQTNFEALSPGQLWRFEVNLETKVVEHQLIESRCCEFPFVHPTKMGQPYRYLYLGAAHTATGNAPLQGILKIDLISGNRQFWSAAPRGFVSEPVFVPCRSSDSAGLSEDNGWVLSVVYDAAYHRSDVVILDARDLNRGPVAKLHLKHHVPYGLHGSFTPQIFAGKD